jgi:hypothetical protein
MYIKILKSIPKASFSYFSSFLRSLLLREQHFCFFGVCFSFFNFSFFIWKKTVEKLTQAWSYYHHPFIRFVLEWNWTFCIPRHYRKIWYLPQFLYISRYRGRYLTPRNIAHYIRRVIDEYTWVNREMYGGPPMNIKFSYRRATPSPRQRHTMLIHCFPSPALIRHRLQPLTTIRRRLTPSPPVSAASTEAECPSAPAALDADPCPRGGHHPVISTVPACAPEPPNRPTTVRPLRRRSPRRWPLTLSLLAAKFFYFVSNLRIVWMKFDYVRVILDEIWVC